MKALSSLHEYLLNGLFPRRCVVCDHEGSWLCESCKPILQPELQQIGNISVLSLFSFDQKAVRELLHNLKFNSVWEVATIITDLIKEQASAQELLALNSLGSQDQMTVVPMSKTREKRRGYNQAELLAKALCPWLGIAIKEVGLRAKNKRTQVGLGVVDRNNAAKLRFFLREDRVISEVSPVLFDDIVTTGSTLNACANLCGAKKAVVIARA